MDLAIEQTYTLNMTSKGIMLDTQTPRECSGVMHRVVQVIFDN
jgi:hypothetical protein|tara:strand:- start:423 stop:551 length:129 start_codon:yes stop_codon:yes gene_type:complete